MTPTSSPPQRARGAGFRALYALGFFLLGVALTWSHWYAHAYGRSVERAAILRQIGPLITGACIRVPQFHPQEPDT